MPEDDLALLAGAAEAAGRLALTYWGKAPAAWEKPGGGGLVTEADLAVNAMLEDALRGARPSYGWHSEESADSPARLGADRVFIVDPIDGTRAFAAGDDGFAVALAVAEAGRVQAAVVVLPARGQTYAAERGSPALLNGAPIRVGDGTDPRPRVLATSGALSSAHWPGGVPEVERSYRPSLAQRLCLVAEGVFDASLTLSPTWEWDAAPGAFIAEMAGAMATDSDGAMLAYNRPDARVSGLICAPPALHARLLARRRTRR